MTSGKAVTPRADFVRAAKRSARIVLAYARGYHETTLNGVPMRLTPELARVFPRSDHPHEAEPFRVVSALLRSGDVGVDVGTNVGIVAMRMAQRVAPDGAVYTFEANPRTFDLLRRNVQLNGYQVLFRLHQCLVGARVEENRPFFAQDSLLANASSVAQREGHTAPIPLPQTTLDVALAGCQKGPHLVNIDVEGAECQVIEGALATLRRARPCVVCEVHQILADGKSVPDLYGLMAGLGYRAMNLALRKEQNVDEFVAWSDGVRQHPDAGDNVISVELGHLLFIPQEVWSGVRERVTAER